MSSSDNDKSIESSEDNIFTSQNTQTKIKKCCFHCLIFIMSYYCLLSNKSNHQHQMMCLFHFPNHRC